MSEKEFKKGLKAHNRKDYKEAFAIFELLAEQRDAQAQFYLGYMYNNGQGVEKKDSGEALKWYKRAAKQGDTEAQHNLALMYGKGHGVPKHNIYSYMWFSLAQANGAEKARELINDLTKFMSSESIDKAQALAKKCWDSNYQDCPE